MYAKLSYGLEIVRMTTGCLSGVRGKYVHGIGFPFSSSAMNGLNAFAQHGTVAWSICIVVVGQEKKSFASLSDKRRPTSPADYGFSIMA